MKLRLSRFWSELHHAVCARGQRHQHEAGRVAGLLAVLVSFSLVASCASTDVGNPAQPDGPEVLALEFSGYSSDDNTFDTESDTSTGDANAGTQTEAFTAPADEMPDAADGADSGGEMTPENPESIVDPTSDVRIHEAWMSYDTAALAGGEQCDEGSISEPFVVELVSGREWPRPELLEPPMPGCSLTLTPAVLGSDLLPAQAPAILSNANLYVVGERADGAPFTIRATIENPIELTPEMDSSFVIEPDLEAVVVSFDLSHWLDAEVVARLESLPEQALDVDETSEPMLVQAVKTGLGRSVEVAPDSNRDGRPQTGELERRFASSPR